LFGSTDSDQLDGGGGIDILNGGFSDDDCVDDEVDKLVSCETVS
jgi:hypothetical protein